MFYVNYFQVFKKILNKSYHMRSDNDTVHSIHLSRNDDMILMLFLIITIIVPNV